MPEHGDTRIVKIKTWDQMEKEFGLKASGNIKCESTFTRNMERSMPRDRLILIEYDNALGQFMYRRTWIISDDMIECFYEDPFFDKMDKKMNEHLSYIITAFDKAKTLLCQVET